MDVQRVHQPLEGQAGALIIKALSHLRGAGAQFLAVSAWTKMSGLRYLEGPISEFRRAGGRVTVVTGIDNRGTSREALEALKTIADASYVVHDRARSFHPKYYVVSDPAGGLVIVGSCNLTRGGLYTNYETFTLFELDFNCESDREFAEGMTLETEELLSHGEVARPIDQDLVDRLVKAGFVLAEERAPRPDEPGGVATEEGDSLFGTRSGLAGAPALTPSGTEAPTSAPRTTQPSTGAPSASAAFRFEKVLSANDVGETGGHQAGMLIPKGDRGAFPALEESALNPSVWLNVTDEFGKMWRWRYVHYNNAVVADGTRDEYRLTRMTPFLSERNAKSGSTVRLERIGETSYRVQIGP